MTTTAIRTCVVLAVLCLALLLAVIQLTGAPSVPSGRAQQGGVISPDDVIAVERDGITPPADRAVIEFKGLVGGAERLGVILSINGDAPRSFFPGEQLTQNVVLERINIADMEVRYVTPVERISFTLATSGQEKPKYEPTPAEAPFPSEAAGREFIRQIDIRFPEGVYAEGITKIQEGQYTVERELLKRQLSKGYVYKHAQFKKSHGGGYIIDEIARGSLFEKAGLEDGDVIRKINDKDVASMMDLMSAYRQFNEQSYIDVTVNRNAEQMTYYFFLK